jgi:hypothetical protein
MHAAIRERAVQLPVRDARLDVAVEILDAEAKQPVHPRQVDRHAAAHRVDVALERRADAERHHRRTVPRGNRHDGGDLRRALGEHDHVGQARRMPRFAAAVVLELCGIGRSAIPEQAAQIGHERRADVV